MRNFYIFKFAILICITFVLATYEPAYAYIGPGAGFAVLTTFVYFIIAFFLASFYLLTWPVRYIIRFIKMRKVVARSRVNRVFIVGLDGMDPDLTARYMKEGKLPNFSALSDKGCFYPLNTTYPAISPVAWSSFLTGTNPGRHNIFDFLARDKRSYLPDLSSALIGPPKKTLNIGKYAIPLGKPVIQLLRKSQPFWKLLGEKGIFSTVIRVPITFPPEKFNGVLLSAMCVPDLKGTQGTFSYWTTDPGASERHTGGVCIPVQEQNGEVNAYIPGPVNTLLKEPQEMRIPFTAKINRKDETVEIKLPDTKLVLQKHQYSDWINLTFKPGLGISVKGISRFMVTGISPHFGLYMTPIHIDPQKPALPISHPFEYSVYLSKLLGPYATLGLAEDTWALNERVLDEGSFLEQVYKHHEEREQMLFNAIDKTKHGLCVCVFDTTDRIQHMFFRYLNPEHPANQGKDTGEYALVIEDLYKNMDTLIGKVMEQVSDNDVIFVMSDHGFKLFQRGVNLNSWLYLNGYLKLKNGEQGGEWFQNVDWENTKAFALGLGGLYLNIKGRESHGIVEVGEPADTLKREIMEKLLLIKDDATGEKAIVEVFNSKEIYHGPYVENAPDLIIGYNDGYRASWDSVTGKVTDTVLEDNTKSWSGDHCVNPRFVPGIFLSNRPIDREDPHISDIAPTVLDLFGLTPPSYMDGKSFMQNGSG